MLAHNLQRTWTITRYQEIIADYNREKDQRHHRRDFRKLADLANSLMPDSRAVEEGLSEDELALFDLFQKSLGKAERERYSSESQPRSASGFPTKSPSPSINGPRRYKPKPKSRLIWTIFIHRYPAHRSPDADKTRTRRRSQLYLAAKRKWPVDLDKDA